MRLLTTHDGTLKWFNDGEVPKYAILSHVWDKDEQTFQDVQKLGAENDTPSLPSGLSAKLRGACEFAAGRGFDWIWVDTCCINKESSAELSEAINSMFAYYSSADVCIVYLADVPDGLHEPTTKGSKFWESRWFTRGWTLQELVAPRDVLFVSQGWEPFGTKENLAPTLEAITGVNREVLTFTRAVSSVSIAERMSWAANRVTTRREDRAYSLMGLFGVYMPTLYGEGMHAFRRLQEELLRSSPDQSLFAWGFSMNPRRNWQVARLGPFADSPTRYVNSDVQGMSTITIDGIPTAAQAFLSAVRPTSSASLEQPNAISPILYETPTYSATNYGIRARVPLIRRNISTSQSAIAILAVRNSSFYVGLVIRRLSREATNHYAVGQRGYRLVHVASDTGKPSPPGWAERLDLVHDDVMVGWEDIYITTTEPWLAQISLKISIVDMSLKMVSEIPASEPSFKLLTGDQHALIALRCLSLMNDSLRQDICKIGDPSLQTWKIPTLATRIVENIPEELQHACKLWLTHLPLSSPDSDLLQELSTFASEHVFHWLEALSLLGELRVALNSLTNAFDWLSKHAPEDVGLLRDADKMLHTHNDILATSPLQLYHGIPMFNLPECDLSRKLLDLSLPKIRLLSRGLGSTPLLGKILKDPRDGVNSVMFMPDNVHVVSGSGRGSVSTWNSRELARVSTFARHHTAVYAVACSPNGKYVASCGDSADIALWDAETGALLRVFAGRGRSHRAVTFSQDGLQIAAGSSDGIVHVWSVATGETIHTLTGHEDWVRAVAFSRTHKAMLASGSDDGTMKIWSIATGVVVHEIRGHWRRVTSVAFSPDDSRIVSGSENGNINIWNTTTGGLVRTVKGHKNHVISAAFTSDGSYILSSSGDGKIRKWDANTGSCLMTFTSSHGCITSFSTSQDGSRIASASGDTIEIWDTHSPSESTEITGRKDAVCSIDFAPDGETFATSSWNNSVRLWNTSNTSLFRTIPHDSRVHSVRFSPDGAILATACEDPTIRLYETRSWKEVGLLTWSLSLDEPRRGPSFAFSPDSTRIAGGSHDSVTTWDVSSRECISAFKVGHHVYALAISPDTTKVATSAADKGTSTRVWDVATGQCVAVLLGQPHIHSLTFSSNGGRIVSRGYDGSVSIDTIDTTYSPSPSSMDDGTAALRFSWRPDSRGEFGWLHFTAGVDQVSKPVCWFPADRRPYSYETYYAWHDDIVVVGSTNGMLTVVDLSDAIRAL